MLLFVVVLLTLLAVLGSAFLVSTRLAAGQVPPSARGDAEFSDTGRAPLQFFESNLASAESAAKLAIGLDLFAREGVPSSDETGAGATLSATRDLSGDLLWRATVAQQFAGGFNSDVYDPMAAFAGTTGSAATAGLIDFPHFNIDQLGGTDPHLAATKPARVAGPTVDRIEWPWISAPLVGIPGFRIDAVFADPFGILNGTGNIIARTTGPGANTYDFTGTGADVLRSNRSPGLYADGAGLNYDAPSPPNGTFPGATTDFYNDRNRQFLGLFEDFNQDGEQDEQAFFAADADGDGVADAGLVPILPEPQAWRYRSSPRPSAGPSATRSAISIATGTGTSTRSASSTTLRCRTSTRH